MVDIIPIDVSEEGVRHDLLGIGWTGAKAKLGFTGQQLLQNRDRIPRHMNGVKWLIRKNGVVDFIFIFTTERRLLKQHLVDEHTKRPPIDRSAIFLIQKNLRSIISKCHRSHVRRAVESLTYFRRHELRSTTERARSAAVPHILLAETVVRNLDVAVQGEQDIVEFQITVDDSILMEVLQCQADFRSIEPTWISVLANSIEATLGRRGTYCARFKPN